MSTLIAIGYPNAETAEEVRGVLVQATKEKLVDLQDAVVVEHRSDGKIKLHQAISTTGAGAAGGALWGGLIGLLFLAPLFGMAIGAASGAVAGKVTDAGVNDDFIKQLGEQPGAGRRGADRARLEQRARQAARAPAAVRRRRDPDVARPRAGGAPALVARGRRARLGAALGTGSADTGAEPVPRGRLWFVAMPLRIALGEDSLIVREGVRQLLAIDPDVEIVAAVADADSLRDACDRHQPDVVLTDIRMPPTNTDEGIRLAGELRDRHPPIGVVVLSQFADPLYALDLLDRGSDGRAYLLKERVHNRAELMAAIRAVADGGSLIDPKIVESLVAARSRAERSPLNELTAREREVLSEIAQGKSNTAIAESLFLTKRAVEKHINSIFLKLGLADAEDVSKRVKAALLFLSDAEGVARAAPSAPR